MALGEAGLFAFAATTLRGSDAIQPLAGLLGGFIIATVLLAAIVVALPARWLAWRRTAYALEGDRLLIRSGWFRRRTVILPVGKIQSVDLSHNAVTRWLGVAALRFGVAGGRGFSSHFIPAIPTEAARQLRDNLLVSVA